MNDVINIPDLTKIKGEFPFFAKNNVHYLDSAATTHKPKEVVEAIHNFYSNNYSTVRRGVYKLSAQATQTYEETRKKVANLIGAESEDEIIYTSGTTQSLNLLAYSYARKFLAAGDEIIISALEHHANIVPWQLACEEIGAKLKVIPVDDSGELIMQEFENLLSPKVKMVSVNYISNAIGTLNPIKEITEKAHNIGAVVIVDGAQSTSHLKVDVKTLDLDFYAFSGHKIYGPTGIGILYGKKELLEKMPPFQSGGDMIQEVTFEKTTFAAPPHRFEAGTPAIAQVIGLNKSIDFLQRIGLDNIAKYENHLLEYGTNALKQIPGLKIIGEAKNKGGILSFKLDGVHPHDIATLLDEMNIVIRSGHHCAQPVMKRFEVSATARASLGIYNTTEDLDALIQGLNKVQSIFK